MSDTYVECLVKAKQSVAAKFFKILLIVLTVIFCVIMLVFMPAMFLALATGVGAYFVNLYTDIEYEYLYLDKVDDLFRESYGGLFSDGLADAEQGETLVYHVDSLGHYSPVEMEVP